MGKLEGSLVDGMVEGMVGFNDGFSLGSTVEEKLVGDEEGVIELSKKGNTKVGESSQW